MLHSNNSAKNTGKTNTKNDKKKPLNEEFQIITEDGMPSAFGMTPDTIKVTR